MDFYLDMARDARGYLRAYGHKDADRLGDDDVALMCFRMWERIPEPRPRTFERSSKPLPALSPEEQAGLAQLQQEVEQGEDLAPRLSTTLLFKHDDPLFNDWGIYHFHLGTSTGPNGFVKRTDHAAFAVIDGGRFLVLDVLPHDPRPYEEVDLLRIWKSDWPESIGHHQVDAVPEPFLIGHSADAAPIRALRDVGLNAPILVDGVAYLPPGGGVTGDGGSQKALGNHDRMAYALRTLQAAWARQFPGVEGRFRLLTSTHGVVQDPSNHLWGWDRAQNQFFRLDAALEQSTLDLFTQLDLD